jgi:hypothetical protein
VLVLPRNPSTKVLAPYNNAFESGRADKQRALGLRPRRRAAQRER